MLLKIYSAKSTGWIGTWSILCDNQEAEAVFVIFILMITENVGNCREILCTK